MARKHEVARIVPTQPESRIDLVQLALRPLRLAFLIDSDSPPERLLKYIDYNTSIWGGMFNVFVPVVGGEQIEADWWEALRAFDPDKIVYCCQPTQDFERQILDEIEPYGTSDWSDKVDEHHREGIDQYDSVPMRFVLAHLYEKIRPVEHSDLRLVNYAESSLSNVCLAAQFGRLEKDLRGFLRDAFKAETVEITGDNLGDYLKLTTSIADKFTPIRLTANALSSSSEQLFGPILGMTVVLLEESNLVEALCFFWNLRRLRYTIAGGISEILLMPKSYLSDPENIQTLATWANEQIEVTNVITLVTPGSKADELVALTGELRKLLPEEFKVEGWYDHIQSLGFRTVHVTTSEEARINGRQFNLTLPEPEWADHARGNMKWVVDIDLQGRPTIGPGKGFIPPKFPGLNRLLAGDREGEWLESYQLNYRLRLSQKYISAMVGTADRYKQVNLPDDQKLFLRFLESKGYQARLTDKSRYATGMIRLLGSYKEAKLLSDPGVRRIFEAMRSDVGFTLDQMYQRARQSGAPTEYEHRDELADLVANLALKGIFIRGYNIRCPNCDLWRWYSLAQVSEQFACVGCSTEIQPPIRVNFSYRLNELFVQGIDQGTIPVLLTNLLVASPSNQSYLFVPGLEVTKGEVATDLDLLAVCNGTISVAEAKTLKEEISDESVEDVYKQLQQICRVATDLDARSVVLGTLMDEVPTLLEERIAKLQGKYPDIKLHVATVDDLERGYFVSLSEDGKETPFGIHDLQKFKSRNDKRGRMLESGEHYMHMRGITRRYTVRDVDQEGEALAE